MIRDLGDYYIWAHNKFREVIKNLTHEEFTQVEDKVGRSIKDLVIHMIVMTESCYSNKPMDAYVKLMEELKTKSKDDIIKFWKTSDENFADVVDKITEDPVIFLIWHTDEKMTITAMENLLMFTDHSTYHRGQLMSALKYLGKEGISSDYYYYLVEKNSKKAVQILEAYRASQG